MTVTFFHVYVAVALVLTELTVRHVRIARIKLAAWAMTVVILCWPVALPFSVLVWIGQRRG